MKKAFYLVVISIIGFFSSCQDQNLTTTNNSGDVLNVNFGYNAT